jgi:phenylacetate-CoA ligase
MPVFRPYTALVSKLLFPLHERLKRHDTVRIRRFLEASQWWTSQQLREFQLTRLRSLLTHADRHVPYYRELFREHAVRVEKITSVDDISRLPFLTKPLIRANAEALKSELAGGLMRFNTGGSSGEPLIFFLGRERVSHDVAEKWRATRWWGVDIGDPEIVVWGSPIELGTQDRLRSIRDKLLRSELLPAFEMSEARLDWFIERIQERRPRMLFGYPSALAHIARHAEKRGVDMAGIGIRVAFVTSERLYDDQRERISRVFGCPVANGYGGRDAGFIAHECPAGGMHISAEDIIVEIVDADGHPLPAGQAGEIVVTHLATTDFPFIRYRTGDVAALGSAPCPCGRGLPVLKEIQGRTTDFVVAQDGTVMHGLALIYTLRALPGISSFKIVQESLNLTRVLLVTDSEFENGAEAQIVHAMKQRLGAAVEIRLEYVPVIAAERSGKFRHVVSHATAPARH